MLHVRQRLVAVVAILQKYEMLVRSFIIYTISIDHNNNGMRVQCGSTRAEARNEKESLSP